nr:DNA repair protein RadC [Methylobacter tundripaludum]
MNTQVTGEIRPAKTTKIPHFVCDERGKYRASKPLTDKQIIKAAKSILDNSFSPGTLLVNPGDAKTWLQVHYQDMEHEVFVCVFLDTRNRVISHEVLFRGTIDGASVYPREVVKRALQLNAGAVIFAHNHPSGATEPSPADEKITRLLKESLGLLDIRALDHFILGKKSVFSFSEHNLI